MKRQILFALILGVTLALRVNAQIPNVPNQNLIAYWPFNGNAQDVSGNSHHGNINSVPLGVDRFNKPSGYLFSEQSHTITIPFDSALAIADSSEFSLSVWVRYTGTTTSPFKSILIKRSNAQGYDWGMGLNPDSSASPFSFPEKPGGCEGTVGSGSDPLLPNTWYHLVSTYKNGLWSFYVNNIHSFDFNCKIGTSFGGDIVIGTGISGGTFFQTIDDIGIWNRALTLEEISRLFTACDKDLNFRVNNPIATSVGQNIQLNAAYNDSSATLTWQTNPANAGWINTPSNSTYTTNQKSLLIKNVQLQNHQQPIRLIASKNGCSDTSNVVNLIIADTCINTVYDTSWVSVTDTLIINTNTGIDNVSILNTIKVYPNPASTHLIINNGDLAKMVGCSIRITNAAGQVVYNKPITENEIMIDLSEWNAKGLYILSVLNSKGTVISTKKIILR